MKQNLASTIQMSGTGPFWYSCDFRLFPYIIYFLSFTAPASGKQTVDARQKRVWLTAQISYIKAGNKEPECEFLPVTPLSESERKSSHTHFIGIL